MADDRSTIIMPDNQNNGWGNIPAVFAMNGWGNNGWGWHFSKAMCEWAVSKMRDRNGNKIQMRTKEQVEAILRSAGVEIENDHGYDKVFVMHMGLSDYVGSSIPDEVHLARYVQDVLDDKDGYDGIAFSRFLADCNGKGVPIIWEDMI